MPIRKVPLITGQYYHIFNRGVAGQPTFTDLREYKRAINLMFYYKHRNPLLKYSHFLQLSSDQKNRILTEMESKDDYQASIIAYCLMPNHFHFLLRQTIDNGIAKFMANFTNSYSRYFNVKTERYGPVFQGRFKAVLIETEEQLLHVVRYIHLNPYTSYVVKSIVDLKNYEFSSLPDYLDKRNSALVDKEIILAHFKNTSDYAKFVFDQADYQRKLETIKHYLLEK